jgi:hypothetical protein
LAGPEEPADGGCVVAKGEDAFGGLGVDIKADEPDVDNHCQEFKQVVNQIRSEDWTGGGDSETPRLSRQEIPSEAEGAGVGPADAGGLADDDLVEGDAVVCDSE